MKNTITIGRKPHVLSLTGFKNSTLYARIKDGVFVPPISLGGRSSGWVLAEVNMVLTAMVAGQSKDELKALVASLVEQRKDALKELKHG